MIEKVRLYSTKQLRKKYIFLDVFQIYPDLSEILSDKKSNEFPFFLELSFSKPDNYTRFSSSFGNATLEKKIIEFCHIFTLISKFYIWGFDYIQELECFSEINEKNILHKEIEFIQNKLLDDRNIEELTIPKYTDIFFMKYWNLNETDLAAFRISAYQFYLGIEIETLNKSLSLTLLVCSIETLVEYQYKNDKIETCECCGNKIYKVTKKFKEFIFENNPNKSKDFKQFVNRLYNARSKILHAGKLLPLDLSFLEKQTEQTSKEYFMRKDAFIQIRICLIEWLMKRNVTNIDNQLLKNA